MTRLAPHAVAALMLLWGCAIPVAHAADAALLHAVFQDHAVLQRDRPIRLWGTAEPGAEVSIALAGKRAQARAGADGRWQAELPALPAGGPHVLTAASGDARQTVRDVLLGDLWLCSGQSNMELQVWRTLDARAEIDSARSDTIRLLTVPQAGHSQTQADFAGPVQWHRTSPDTARDFSAACYYFARELQKSVDVPMGLISAAWGGSRIQAWISPDALRGTGWYTEELAVLERHASDPLAAAAQWGDVWARWWRHRPGVRAGDEPWSADDASGQDWRTAPRELGAWEHWGVPELAAFDGMLWYRTRVTLTAAQAEQDAVLELAPADEIDLTWVNGRAVGSTYGAGDARAYRLPSGLLRAGENSIVVNVLDTWRDGGLAGPASAHALRFADGSRAPLDGPWRYRIVPGGERPPQAPWLSAGGLSTLYNGMIAPLGRYGQRGMLWYQGESNTDEAARYRELLRILREDWRAHFGEGLPMLIVQLANHGTPPTAPGESGWAALREAQRLAAAEDPRSGLAVTIDIGDRYDIHPPNKQELGRRLARAARHVVYGEKLPPSGPVPLSAKRDGDAVAVTFGDITGKLLAYGSDGPVGFELCGDAAGSCRYADADIRGDTVLLRAPVSDVTRVRYGWADSPVVTLFDGAGLPAGPFEMPVR